MNADIPFSAIILFQGFEIMGGRIKHFLHEQSEKFIFVGNTDQSIYPRIVPFGLEAPFHFSSFLYGHQ